MQLKYLVYITTLTTGTLAASSDFGGDVVQGISMLTSKLDSFTQKFKTVSTSPLGLPLIPGMVTDISGAKASLDQFVSTSQSMPAGSITPEECEQMVVALQQMQGTIDSSFKVFAGFKSVMDNLPGVGIVTPHALNTILDFKKYSDYMHSDFIPKLPANCTSEVEPIAANIDAATASIINTYST